MSGDISDCLTAIDELDDLVHDAPSVYPFGGEARVSRRKLDELVRTLLDTLPAEVASRPEIDAHDRLAELVRNARPVPLIGAVRIDRKAVYELLDLLRRDIPEVMAGFPPLTPEQRRLRDALHAVHVLVERGLGLLRRSAKVDAARWRAAIDEVHAAAPSEYRRLDRDGALDELDRLAEDAGGDEVRVSRKRVEQVRERLEDALYEWAGGE